jgi:uncharacterized membrane protein YczE
MKKIRRCSELLWLLGIIFIALGVTICSKADLGVSMIAAPAFILFEALSPIYSALSVGVLEYLLQGLLLIILCICVRRFNWRYLLAFGVAVLYGYTLNFFLFIFSGVSFDSVLMRWVMLIVGDIITATGVACFFRTYMPLKVYDLFVAEMSRCFSLNINRVKLFFDLSMLAFSLLLVFTLFGDIGEFDFRTIAYGSFHNIGLGTIVTTLINSPIIKFSGSVIDRLFEPTPLLPRVERVLKRQ